ncbi:MAG: hypothetical protein EA376_06965 [Phycisphaeraceae bacterium]|nr:MAG: hypothetical protein EA376_06965 [Phycisphaeraceae bacterium]
MKIGQRTHVQGGRRGFTLRELITLIAIAVILLGMMAPALGEARRTSRMTMDLLDLMQHAILKENYVAANKGRMPNAPPGVTPQPAPDGKQNFGGPDRPTRFFAHPDNPHNGWAVPGGFRHDHTWKLHHIAFGEYLVDGQGLDMLDEVFVSSGAHQFIDVGENWRRLRSGEFDEDIFENFQPQSNVSGRNIFSSTAGSQAFALNPSYRYTATALYGDSEYEARNFWTGASPDGVGFPHNPQIPGWQGQNWTSFRTFVQQSDFAFPSRKVLFFSVHANHNRNVNPYTQQGADIPILLVDGSVRISRPWEEMPDPNSFEYIQAVSKGEPWAASQDFRWEANSLIPILGVPWAPYAWFAATLQGPAGYDFQNEAP